jgi:hypothetical protein
MSEPITTGTIALLFKGYILPAIAIFMGALAHSLQEVKKNGWKGGLMFSADLIIASVAGYIFYQSVVLFNPNYMMVAASLGGYLGPASVKFVIKAWQANAPK